MSIGVGIAGSMTSGDVDKAMAAFASVSGAAAPMRSYQTLAQTNGPRIALPVLPALGASLAPPTLPVGVVGGSGAAGMSYQQGKLGALQGGAGGGTATVVIGLEPGLIARQLQQDPARGVVVQIARATAAKSPGRSTY